MHAKLIGVLSGVVLACSAVAQDTAVIPGWRGDARIWRSDGDTIVGSSHGVKLKANTFLIRDGEYGDFEFRCEFRLEGNNSGVQYRSRPVGSDPFRVHGFQCDIHPNPPYAAMLYDEGGLGITARRGQFVRLTDDGGSQPLGAIAKPRAADLTQWHRLRVVARGDLSWHELDGEVVTAVQDRRAKASARGLLALQVHAGPPMRVWFRDVDVRELSRPDDVAIPPAVHALLQRAEQQPDEPVGPLPQWIWDAQVDGDEEVFFRRSFRLDAVPASARLAFAADNHARVYVNGERVANTDEWERAEVRDVREHLVAGDNVIAVHAWNDGGPAGLALRLSWPDGDGQAVLVSDADWRCSADDPDGYDRPGFDDASWQQARSVGALGARGGTWSEKMGPTSLGSDVDDARPQIAILDPEIDAAGVTAASAWQLLEIPRSLGSWVSLGVDDRGRVYSCDQRGAGIFRVEPAMKLGEPSTITHMPAELSGAHGLLWWRGALYAVCGNEKTGFYRVTDSDGDDLLDRVEQLRELGGSGEHGPHSVVVAPDGEHLLVLAGNMTPLTDIDASRVPTNWQEDRLVERINDARGFWGGYSPPGGCLYQVDVERNHWELVCCGFRNPFDLAVLPNGQVVVYDADMEWDMGSPWYRPTRWVAAQSGVDYGWRKGTAKWPADYPDAPQPLLDIGPGSPTGMTYVPGERGGVIGLDWTFGTVYRDGEPCFTGAPFPVADVAYDPNRPGGVYVVSGGRGLPARLHWLPLPKRRDGSPKSWGTPVAWPAEETRSAEQILDGGRNDGWVAARISLERLPAASFRAAALQVDAARPERGFAGLMALARQGEAADLQPILAALATFDWRQLDHWQRIAWLRTHALALLRLGPASDAQRQLVADRLLPLFPAGNERQDQDLCELLCYVDAPGVLAKAVPLLTPLRPSAPPPWAELATRNAKYGGVIDKMRAEMPPMGQIAIAHALTLVDHGWTEAQRRTLFTFLAEARQRSGGSSYDGFVIRIIDLVWKTCSDDERAALDFLVGRARAKKQGYDSKPPKGPGKDWQLDDIPMLATELDGRKAKSGRNLFWAVGCASCHYFEGEGGFGGPDLTSLRNKFRAEDLLESILEPSKVISDQYSGQVLTKKDGSTLFGVVRRTFDGDMEVYEVVEAKADATPVRIPVGEVEKVEHSKVSPMPRDLIDRMSRDEVRDLVAFLLGKSEK